MLWPALFVLLLVSLLLGWRKRSHRLLVVGGAGLSIVAFVWFFFVFRTTAVSGLAANVDLLASKPHLGEWAARLPSGATDIEYYVQPFLRVVYISFRVSEEDFRKWALERRWDCKRVEDSPEIDSLVETYRARAFEVIGLRKGLYCLQVMGGGPPRHHVPMEEIAYDGDRGLAYYHCNSG